MSAMDNNGTERAVEYLDAIKGSWPLVLLTVGIATASGLRQLKRGYKQRTKAQKAVTFFLNATLTSSLILGCVNLLPLLIPDVTPGMQLAAASVLASLGGETVKQLLFHKLGLSIIDLMDPHDINAIRVSMTPEQRVEHVRNCPFKHDECREPCKNCPEVKHNGETTMS